MAAFLSPDLARAAARLAAGGEAQADGLNTADGLLGDGDLGVTVAQGWRAAAGKALPDDVGMAFLAMAKAFQSASPSSFGTLMATALMSAASACKGRSEVPWSEVSALLGGARDAMMARGKGELGQKSVLDIVDALAKATAGLDDPVALLAAAAVGSRQTLNDFRGKPAGLGRARIFAEKSKGLDDPGMLAVNVMIGALAG